MFKLSDLKNAHIPILPCTPNFYWDEYLQNNLMVKGYEDKDFNTVEEAEIMYCICVHACCIQEFRNWYGKSIEGESGHRPELYNDVVLIELGYGSTKTSDHKFNKAGAFDTDVPATTKNANKWKEICVRNGLAWSIGLYNWGMHLGFRIDKQNRLWDNR